MSTPLLDIQQLSKNFYLGKNVFTAVQNVSLSIMQGESLGLGGESGCGKSTLAKLVMRLISPSSGSIFFEGKNLYSMSYQEQKKWRSQIQMVFQHPSTSLNPRFTVFDTLAEPFKIHGLYQERFLKDQIVLLLQKMGLSEAYLYRFPHELSGGQKQRIAIARALSVHPQLLVCDEPFSALDVSVQAQIIQLLKSLQRELKLSYLIISHDLAILRYLTQKLAIMYQGHLVEYGPSQEVYEKPCHPYSQLLVSAILSTHLCQKNQNPVSSLKRPIFNQGSITPACPFYSRCPYAQSICQTTKPVWQEIKPGHFAACHFIKK